MIVISTDRNCDAYFLWHPGFTPKEHVQMQLAAQLKQEIEDRRLADEERAEQRRQGDKERDEARRDADRVWQRQQEDDKRVWQHQQEEGKRNWQKQEETDRRAWQAEQENIRFRRGVIQGVGLAVLAVILTLLAEPWKGKPEPLPPQVTVNLPPEAFKK